MKLGDRMDAVMTLSLKAPAKSVLFVLARRANDKTGKSWPSLNRLSSDSGNSRRTTSRVITELERRGLLMITRHPRKVSDYTINLGAFRVALESTQGSQKGTRNPSLNLAAKSRPQKSTKSQYHKCVSCGKWPTIDGDAKLCLKCWRVENPKRRARHE